MIALKLQIPRSWVELNNSQLLFVAGIISNIRGKYDLLIPALMEFTGLRVYKEGDRMEESGWYTHPSMKNPFILDNEQLAVMADRLEYLMDIKECHPIRWIRMARARHFRLYNASFEEYLLAENYFFAYSKTYQVQHLENMMAVLYRSPLEKFSAGKVEKRAKKFRKVSIEKKNAMFIWYVGFRSYVRRRCPNLFSDAGKGGVDVRQYVNGIIHTLNNGDITLTEKLMVQPAWSALDELEQRARIAEEQDRQKQKLNRK